MKIVLPIIVFGLALAGHFVYFAWRDSPRETVPTTGGECCPQVAGNAGCGAEALMPPNTLASYLEKQEYLLGMSYGLALGFTAFCVLLIGENRKRGVTGALGGLGLSGLLALTACWLVGCCGSPLLPVYLSLFGGKFLGFAKPLIFGVTLASVAGGCFWMRRKSKCPESCCARAETPGGMQGMEGADAIQKIASELSGAMSQAKCRRCECMKETLENLEAAELSPQPDGYLALVTSVKEWLGQMEPTKYSCLGCEHCYAAVATNLFSQAFPEAALEQSAVCGFEIKTQDWPPVAGEYFAFCEGDTCPVAVSTLASVELAAVLAKRRPKELCIVGKTETENIGVDKVIKNTITNPTIRAFILTGRDPHGHLSGRTLLALWENGVDDNMKVIDSPGRRPVLRNVTRAEVEAFRRQVEMVDMIGCENADMIVERVKKLSGDVRARCSIAKSEQAAERIPSAAVPIVVVREHQEAELDKSGYFVIIPQPKRGIITVEHYSYDNELQRVIEGGDARSICSEIVKNGWIAQLSHAAYLGRELAKAELSIKLGFKYVQDGA